MWQCVREEGIKSWKPRRSASSSSSSLREQLVAEDGEGGHSGPVVGDGGPPHEAAAGELVEVHARVHGVVQVGQDVRGSLHAAGRHAVRRHVCNGWVVGTLTIFLFNIILAQLNLR